MPLGDGEPTCGAMWHLSDGVTAHCFKPPGHDGHHFGHSTTWEWGDEESEDASEG